MTETAKIHSENAETEDKVTEEKQTQEASGRTGEAMAEEPGADRLRLLKQAGIHLLAGLGAICLWAGADAWYTVTGLTVANGVVVLASLVFGGVIAHLAHEWSHFAGARFSGSISPVKEQPAALMFDFDYEKNSPQQFLATSIGGSVGNWLLVLLVAVAIPLDTPGRAMLLAAVVGMAVFVAVFEWPVIAHAWRHRDPLAALTEGFADLQGTLRRAVIAGAVATLVLWILLIL